MNDLAILGGGPAGYTAAERALKSGLSVIIFEKNTVGGTCLNEGCIPTKALLYSAKQYHNALASAKYGVQVAGVSFDYAKMHARKTKVVRKLVAGVKAKLQHETCTLVQGEATVHAYDHEKVVLMCNDQLYEAKRLLICTGSQNLIPPIPGVDSPHVWDSTDALNAKELPESITIVGGGVIGIEFASLYNALGVRVAVVEMQQEILPHMDAEIAAMQRADLTKAGVQFYLHAQVTSIREQRVSVKIGDEETLLESDKIMVCVGRQPSWRGLEKLPLETYGKGVRVNEYMQTNLPNIYAAGDITGYSMLAHTAVCEAEVAVAHLVGNPYEMEYAFIPSVVYTNPEVASVGQTEQQLLQNGVGFDVLKLPMSYSGRFVAENEGVNGLCKLLVERASRQVLGIHLYGNGASEIINLAALACSKKLSAYEWRKMVVGHPTVTEILKETLWEIE